MPDNSDSENLAAGRRKNHRSCLDMVEVEWRPSVAAACSESAIVLEIWSGGAMLHISAPIPVGSDLTICANRRVFAGHVVECARDFDFGFLLEMEVRASEEWFPQDYAPAWQLPISSLNTARNTADNTPESLPAVADSGTVADQLPLPFATARGQ